MRLIGFEAIEYAGRAGLALNKVEDSIDPAAVGLTVPEAEAIADERGDLIWLEVAEAEYYEKPKNFQPGTAAAPVTTLAGQRADELLPDQSGEEEDEERGVAGTPGQTPVGSGVAESDEQLLPAALAAGEEDPAGDRRDADPQEAQSGSNGGALRGTPANKRTSRR
jgi:hypothetical protein